MVKIAACVLLALFAAGVSFSRENPVLDGQLARAEGAKPLNRARVEADMKRGAANPSKAVYYVVPALSDRMRLMDTFPDDGRFMAPLRIIAARDEFETASFQIFPFENMKDMKLDLSAIENEKGDAIDPGCVDIKIVKLWLQNGNAWLSYFADVGLKLVPELALHDENLVKVDLQKEANFARLSENGKERHEWISAPHKLDPYPSSFANMHESFADSAVLQPFALEKNCFKQFLVTVSVPKDQQPGTYRGKLTLSGKGGSVFDIPILVRVLPFVLPRPRPYHDLDGEFLVSFMGGITLSGVKSRIKDEKRAVELYTGYLKDMRDHGVSHPGVDQDKESFAILRSLGMPTKPVLWAKSFLPWFGLNFGGRMSFDNMMRAKDASEKMSAYYNGLVGHNDLITTYGDEQGAAFMTAHRKFYSYFIEKGIKIGSAGHEALLYKSGYAYGFYPMGGSPDNEPRIRPWREMGGKYIGFYATQHNGAENPQFVRRQHGLSGYFSGLNVVCNYEFALGPWNDRGTSLYRPMVVSYMSGGGLVETLAFIGFREGIDDIRYMTHLKMLARRAEQTGGIEAKIEARKAMQFMALIPRETADLNYLRQETIAHILALHKALGE